MKSLGSHGKKLNIRAVLQCWKNLLENHEKVMEISGCCSYYFIAKTTAQKMKFFMTDFFIFCAANEANIDNLKIN